MTLDDHYALCFKLHAFLEIRTFTKMSMKTYLHCQQQRCSQKTLVSGNTRFMWIFEGFLRDGVPNDSGVIENVHFLVLSEATSSEPYRK